MILEIVLDKLVAACVKGRLPLELPAAIAYAKTAVGNAIANAVRGQGGKEVDLPSELVSAVREPLDQIVQEEERERERERDRPKPLSRIPSLFALGAAIAICGCLPGRLRFWPSARSRTKKAPPDSASASTTTAGRSCG